MTRWMIGLIFLGLGACSPSQTEENSQTHAVSQNGQVLAVPTGAASTSPAQASSSPSAPGSPWLGYYTVTTGAALPMLPVPGLVSPLESSVWAVSSRVSGRIDNLRVMLGQQVTKGQQLVLVRSTDFAELWRDMKVAASQETLRSQELDNARTLSEAHVLPQKELKEAEQSLREATLNHQTSQEKLNALNVRAEGENAFWLTSPHSGVVVDLNVTTGQEVGPDSEPLIKIARLDQMLVTAQAFESDIDGLKPGQTARVFVPGRSDQQVQAKILSVSQAVDPHQHTVPVRLLVSSSPTWMRPNSYVQVSFNRAATQPLIVPTEAVVTDDLKSIVFIKNAQTGKFERRPVIVGRQGTEQTEILSGLRKGEVIVSKGAILLLNEVNS